METLPTVDRILSTALSGDPQSPDSYLSIQYRVQGSSSTVADYELRMSPKVAMQLLGILRQIEERPDFGKLNEPQSQAPRDVQPQ